MIVDLTRTVIAVYILTDIVQMLLLHYCISLQHYIFDRTDNDVVVDLNFKRNSVALIKPVPTYE